MRKLSFRCEPDLIIEMEALIRKIISFSLGSVISTSRVKELELGASPGSA